MSSSNVFIGIDFGTKNCAVGILQDGKAYSYFLEFSGNLTETYNQIAAFVDNLFLSPKARVFIEGVFKGPNQKTFEGLVRIQTLLSLIFQQRGHRVEFLGSTSWRKILFGTSRLKKTDCEKFARERWGFLEDQKKSEISHRADSLMVALAGGVKTGALIL